MRRIQFLALVATIGSAVGLGSAGAAGAQALGIHWGEDSRPIAADECARRAKEIIGVKGFSVTTAGTSVEGSGPGVVVLVDCVTVQQGAHILVVAVSPDGTLAERTRNEVRIAVMR
jgi:hypothetical protein